MATTVFVDNDVLVMSQGELDVVSGVESWVYMEQQSSLCRSHPQHSSLVGPSTSLSVGHCGVWSVCHAGSSRDTTDYVASQAVAHAPSYRSTRPWRTPAQRTCSHSDPATALAIHHNITTLTLSNCTPSNVCHTSSNDTSTAVLSDYGCYITVVTMLIIITASNNNK